MTVEVCVCGTVTLQTMIFQCLLWLIDSLCYIFHFSILPNDINDFKEVHMKFASAYHFLVLMTLEGLNVSSMSFMTQIKYADPVIRKYAKQLIDQIPEQMNIYSINATGFGNIAYMAKFKTDYKIELALRNIRQRVNQTTCTGTINWKTGQYSP